MFSSLPQVLCHASHVCPVWEHKPFAQAWVRHSSSAGGPKPEPSWPRGSLRVRPAERTKSGCSELVAVALLLALALGGLDADLPQHFQRALEVWRARHRESGSPKAMRAKPPRSPSPARPSLHGPARPTPLPERCARQRHTEGSAEHKRSYCCQRRRSTSFTVLREFAFFHALAWVYRRTNVQIRNRF